MKAELRRALQVIAAAQKTPPPDMREKDRAEIRSFLRVVQGMAKPRRNPQTTAQLRAAAWAAAWAAEEARDYERAADLLQAALDVYPATSDESAKHGKTLMRARIRDLRGAARSNPAAAPCVPAPKNLELSGASFRFGQRKGAMHSKPKATRTTRVKHARTTPAKVDEPPMPSATRARARPRKGRRGPRLPLLAEIRYRGGISKKDALALWGKQFVEGAPRGVFTRKGRSADTMAFDLGAEKWFTAQHGEDQVGEMADKLRAEVFGHASPHPHADFDLAALESEEMILAARGGDAAAQAALEKSGVNWNPRARRNPHLLTIAGNPATIDAKAVAAYRKFHGVQPKSAVRVGKGSGVLIALGSLVDIVYKPTRGDRRGPAWIHRFGRGAVLASTPDGSKLFIVDTKGKRQMVDWSRGIVR